MGCTKNISNDDYYIILSFSIFSIIFSVGLIGAIVAKGLLKDFCMRIVFYMTVNDLIRGIIFSFMLPGFVENKELCMIIAFAIGSTYMSNILLGISITIVMYQALIKNEYDYFKYHLFWVLLCFFIVPALYALPLFTESLGNDGGFCFFKNDIVGNIWRFILNYLPSLFCLIFGSFVFFKVRSKIKKYRKDATTNLIFVRGYLFALIILAMVTPLMILKTYELAENECNSPYMSSAIEVWMNFHSVFNAIAFVITEKSKKKFIKRSTDMDCLNYSSESLVDK
ncbi:hypothetical protein SteCoe_38787 [Stentor coeruleus]|uniref:G-protein coupled receptors family 2 profile 2 domain-containing protein n=1 Tax=Stentor coeruleus TaxID=5963 RepID=A0A1R2AL45_9CILI|nr:hypothetical protein SteCoe_38787 [Stentor coeruleus]